MDRSSAAVDLKPARQPQCPSPVAAAASAVPASQPGPPQGLSTPSAPASASASVSVSTSASSISSAATALSASTATAGGPQVVGGGGAVGTSPPSCAQLVSAAATPAGGVAHLLLTPSAIPASSGTGGIVSPSSALVGWMTEDIPELPSMADTISSNQLGPSGMRANGLSLMNSGTVKEVHRNSGQAVHIAPFSVPSDPPEDTMGILSPGLHSEAPVPLFAPNLAMSASTPTSRKATVASDSASFTTSKQYCRNAAGPSHSSVVFHLSAASSSSHLLGIFVDGPGSFSTRPGSAPPTPQIAGLQLQQDFTRHPKAEFKQPCASKRSAEGNPAFKKPSRRRLRMRRLRQTWSSPEELAKALHARMSGATRRRHSLLNERRTRLRLRSDYIKARVIVHRQEEKIASIRLRAKGSLGMVSASLNRLILRRRLRKSKSRADPACEESLRELSEVKRVLHNAFTELSDDSFLRLQTPADLEVAMSKLAAVESSLRGYTNWADLGMAELSPFLQPSMVIGAERSDQPHEPDACKYPAPHSAPTSTSVGDDLTSSIPLGCLPASLPGSVFSPEEHPHHVFSRHSVAEPSPWLLPPLVPTTEKLQDLPNHSHSTTVMSLHPSLFSELSPVQAAPSIDGVLPHPSEYDGFTHTPQAFTVPNSPLPFGDNPLFVSGGKSCESLANVVVRKKYLPVQMFDELDEDEYLDLVSLLPPITRFTLRELDIDEILSNVQLRHDLYFDPNLQFKPNTDGDRGDQRRNRTDAYWSQVEEETRAGVTYRLPLLLFEIRSIIVEMLPYSESMKEGVEANLDIRLMAQELSHNVLNAEAYIHYLADLLKANCAPARDPMIDSMLSAGQSGSFVSALRICFELVEMMKLDYANHQLLRLRPYVVENSIEFEWNWFQEELKANAVTIGATQSWFADTYSRLRQSGEKHPPLSLVYADGLVHLLQHCPALCDPNTAQTNSGPIPLHETLRMDCNRLLTFRNDWQDITIMATLLILFRQASGPRCTASHQSEMKATLWVLLNDTDTSLSHIVLEVARTAGTIRGKAFSDAEVSSLSGLVEKTLSPESRLYGLVWSRIGEHLRSWLVSTLDRSPSATSAASGCGTDDMECNPASSQNTENRCGGVESDSDSDEEEEAGAKLKATLMRSAAGRPSTSALHPVALNKALLARHGLTELETEMRDLSERLGKLGEFNRATYFEIYRQLYEESRALN